MKKAGQSASFYGYEEAREEVNAFLPRKAMHRIYYHD
jgi:hypothetical protein